MKTNFFRSKSWKQREEMITKLCKANNREEYKDEVINNYALAWVLGDVQGVTVDQYFKTFAKSMGWL